MTNEAKIEILEQLQDIVMQLEEDNAEGDFLSEVSNAIATLDYDTLCDMVNDLELR